MTVRNRLISSICLAALLLAAGCASKPAVPAIDASTRFEDLRGILMAKVKTTQSRTVPGGWVPRAVEDLSSPDSVNFAVGDFQKWCAVRSGAFRDPDFRGAEGRLKQAQITAARINSEGWFSEWSCQVGEDVYLLERGRDRMRDYRPGRFNGARLAWLSSAELDKIRPEVDAATAAEVARREARAAKDKQERLEQDRQRKEEQVAARAKAIAMLKNPKPGSQLACIGEHWEGETLAQVKYECQGSEVSFKDLSENGWRIVQQTVTPKVDRRARIDLISVMLVKGKP
jgi:hypothetical protein